MPDKKNRITFKHIEMNKSWLVLQMMHCKSKPFCLHSEKMSRWREMQPSCLLWIMLCIRRHVPINGIQFDSPLLEELGNLGCGLIGIWLQHHLKARKTNRIKQRFKAHPVFFVYTCTLNNSDLSRGPTICLSHATIWKHQSHVLNVSHPGTK